MNVENCLGRQPLRTHSAAKSGFKFLHVAKTALSRSTGYGSRAGIKQGHQYYCRSDDWIAFIIFAKLSFCILYSINDFISNSVKQRRFLPIKVFIFYARAWRAYMREWVQYCFGEVNSYVIERSLLINTSLIAERLTCWGNRSEVCILWGSAESRISS